MTKTNEPTQENQEILERLQTAIEAVIKRQIQDNDPPEVIESLERLQEEGYTKQQAYNLVGQLVSLELAETLHTRKQFDKERYVHSLAMLPFPFIEKTNKNKEPKADV